MNDLVIMHDQQAVTTSLKVAEVFGKRHDHVVRDIEALRGDVPNFGEMYPCFKRRLRMRSQNRHLRKKQLTHWLPVSQLISATMICHFRRQTDEHQQENQ